MSGFLWEVASIVLCVSQVICSQHLLVSVNVRLSAVILSMVQNLTIWCGCFVKLFCVFLIDHVTCRVPHVDLISMHIRSCGVFEQYDRVFTIWCYSI